MANSSLPEHPIFDVPESSLSNQLGESSGSSNGEDNSNHSQGGPTNMMLLRGSDLILAVGKELRITTIVESKVPGTSKTSYKVCCRSGVFVGSLNLLQVLHAPSVDFPVKQLSLSPEGNLLAVVGERQLAVVILPRPGYSRMPGSNIECK